MVTIKFRYKQPDGDKSKMEQVIVTDKPESLAKTSDDFRFASSVAELGLLLRDSQFKQNADFGSLTAGGKRRQRKRWLPVGVYTTGRKCEIDEQG